MQSYLLSSPDTTVGQPERQQAAHLRACLAVRQGLWLLLLALLVTSNTSWAQDVDTTTPATTAPATRIPEVAPATEVSDEAQHVGCSLTPAEIEERLSADKSKLTTVSKASVLVGSFTVFLLAVFVGFEIIAKVPPTLHTPLMSGSNAISGITVVGAMLTAGAAAMTTGHWFGTLLGFVAVVLAMINVVGGFLVTHRMLKMFKKR